MKFIRMKIFDQSVMEDSQQVERCIISCYIRQTNMSVSCVIENTHADQLISKTSFPTVATHHSRHTIES